jgi:hypothetical protein
MLRDIGDRDGALKAGARIQVGWSILTLRSDNNDLTVMAPDVALDPCHDLTEDLTTTLTVQAWQNDVLKLVGVDGQAAVFCDKIVLARGTLSLSRLYLERSANPPKGDSGWYIGPADGAAATDFEAIFVYQLWASRRALLRVLALPPGYLVVFGGDTIEAVVGPNDVDLWQATDTPGPF